MSVQHAHLIRSQTQYRAWQDTALIGLHVDASWPSIGAVSSAVGHHSIIDGRPAANGVPLRKTRQEGFWREGPRTLLPCTIWEGGCTLLGRDKLIS